MNPYTNSLQGFVITSTFQPSFADERAWLEPTESFLKNAKAVTNASARDFPLVNAT